MRVLVLGAGGREHALVWKLARSPSVDRILAAPGNPGIGKIAELRLVDPSDAAAVEGICRAERIDLVVVGPERPLIEGVADRLRENGFTVYGPGVRGAMLEGSKAFSKRLMAEEGIPTAPFETFTGFAEARAYIQDQYSENRRVVVKASGEALGKGAVVAESEEHAIQTAEAMLVRDELGEAGRTVVIERFLEGAELSLMAVCNGTDYRLLPTSRDYKAAFDGGEGPNTGGMGACSPACGVSAGQIEDLGRTFVEPVLRRFERDGEPYVGTLYPGLIITEEGSFALEYNVRFGDPEAQAVLPRLDMDLARLLMTAARKEALPEIQVSESASAVVVLAARGYPGEYLKGIECDKLDLLPNVEIFHAGTKLEGGRLVSAGGRVLNVMAMGSSTRDAAEAVYTALDGVLDDRWHFRRDICLRQQN